LARIATTLLVLGLLGGTAAAFAVTEGLKLEKSPVSGVRVDNVVFAPSCDCPTRKAHFSIRLRKSDEVALSIVRDGEVVRTLIYGRRFSAGWHGFTWNGRDDYGAFVPEGEYQPKVHLAGQHRTIVLPNDLRVDRTAPKLAQVSVKPLAISPDGDGRSDTVVVGYHASEPAHGLLFVDGVQRVRTRSQQPTSSLKWSGTIDGAPVPAGTYHLSFAAEDRAGNVSQQTRPVSVLVRYIALGRGTVTVKALARFGIRVTTDATSFHWRFAGRSGTAKPGLLVLTAPKRPGHYQLFVDERGHGARAMILVTTRGQQ
jgi:flagellar hook assembly protein FlgD